MASLLCRTGARDPLPNTPLQTRGPSGLWDAPRPRRPEGLFQEGQGRAHSRFQMVSSFFTGTLAESPLRKAFTAPLTANLLGGAGITFQALSLSHITFFFSNNATHNF